MSAMTDMASSSGTMAMSMTFTSGTGTPLYSTAWTPTTTGAYAGTCIFLIVLSSISRLLSHWRHNLEQKWHDKAINRRYIVVSADKEAETQDPPSGKDDRDGGVLTVRGVDEDVRIIRSRARENEATPWRLSTDVPRAVIFTIQAGVGYLLMLAVMTMNVGYFFSVLAGLFVSELLLGRFIPFGAGLHV